MPKIQGIFTPYLDSNKLLNGRHLQGAITASEVSASGDVSASNFHGTITSSNISGTVANATNALTASFVTASNVSGRVASASNALTASLAVLVKDADSITFTVNNASQADNSDKLGNTLAADWNLQKVTDNGSTTTAHITASTFSGSGIGLYNIPAAGVTDLNLDKIENGIYSASIISGSHLTESRLVVNTNISSSGVISGSNFFKDGSILITSSSVSTSITALSSSASSARTALSSSASSARTALSSSASSARTALSSSASSARTSLSSSASSARTSLSSSIASTITSLSSSESSARTSLSSSIASTITSLSSSESSARTALSSSISTTVNGKATLNSDSNTFTGAITSSGLLVSGSAVITGSMIFNGISFTETVIASSTGSHVFGSGSDTNTHTFTGSVFVSNQISASNLSGTNTGDQDLTNLATLANLNASSSALQNDINTRATIDNLNASSSALQNDINTRATIDNLNASSSALQNDINTRATIDNLNASSSTLQSSINSKANSASPTFTGIITASNFSASGFISGSAIHGTSFKKNGVELGTSDFVAGSVGEHLLPDTDNAYTLGSSAKKWNAVFATDSFFGGIHEINLETKGIGELPEGTILVYSDTGLIPCNEEADYLVMGVSSPGTDCPIVLGAEPVLVDGPISAGDFIITSNRKGYGKAAKLKELYTRNYLGKVIAQSLEDSDGGLVKAMIRKM